MGIARMNKVYILGHQNDKDRILSVLQQAGLLEINDLSQEDGENQERAALVEKDRETEAVQKLDSLLAEVKFNLDFLNSYHPQKKGLLDDLLMEKEALSVAEVKKSVPKWVEISRNVNAALKRIDEELLALRNEKTRLQNQKQQLLPWEQLSVPLELLRSTKTVLVEAGTVPAGAVEEIKNEHLENDVPCHLEVANTERGEDYIVIVYHHGEAESVQNVLRKAGFARQDFSRLTGTPKENLSRLDKELARAEKKQEELLAEIEELVQYRKELQFYYDYLATEKDRKEVVENLGRTAYTFILEGWVRQADAEKLKKKLADASDSIEIVIREPLPGENYPVQLENKSFFAPFEFVTKLYGAPHPEGIDPTAALTPFFIVFFGLCLTDAGYGLLLMVLAALGLAKVKGESMRNLFKILFFGGLATVVAGWLVGGWFGYQILGAPLAFDALADPIRFLIISLALGLIHIFWGLAVKFIHLVRSGKYFDAFADVVLWYVFIAGLLLLALPAAAMYGKYLAIIGAAGLVLTQGRTQQGIIKKIFSGIASLYDISGYLSDLLSYSRLLALGLATGVVALTVNTMAELLSGSPIGYPFMVLLLIGGHLLNLAINALGSFIHTSRLQYIEFYNRFYEDGGRYFRPFGFKTRYLEIVPENGKKQQ